MRATAGKGRNPTEEQSETKNIQGLQISASEEGLNTIADMRKEIARLRKESAELRRDMDDTHSGLVAIIEVMHMVRNLLRRWRRTAFIVLAAMIGMLFFTILNLIQETLL